jgi:hypothetical protein
MCVLQVDVWVKALVQLKDLPCCSAGHVYVLLVDVWVKALVQLKDLPWVAVRGCIAEDPRVTRHLRVLQILLMTHDK